MLYRLELVKMLYPCRLKSRAEKAEEKEAAEISFSYNLLDSFIDGAFPALAADYENELFMIDNEDLFQIADDLEKRFSHDRKSACGKKFLPGWCID